MLAAAILAYSASIRRSTSGSRKPGLAGKICGDHRIGNESPSHDPTSQFQQGARHVIIVGHDQNASILMIADPAGDLVGVADRVERVIANIDTTSEKIRRRPVSRAGWSPEKQRDGHPKSTGAVRLYPEEPNRLIDSLVAPVRTTIASAFMPSGLERSDRIGKPQKNRQTAEQSPAAKEFRRSEVFFRTGPFRRNHPLCPGCIKSWYPVTLLCFTTPHIPSLTRLGTREQRQSFVRERDTIGAARIGPDQINLVDSPHDSETRRQRGQQCNDNHRCNNAKIAERNRS